MKELSNGEEIQYTKTSGKNDQTIVMLHGNYTACVSMEAIM